MQPAMKTSTPTATGQNQSETVGLINLRGVLQRLQKQCGFVEGSGRTIQNSIFQDAT